MQETAINTLDIETAVQVPTQELPSIARGRCLSSAAAAATAVAAPTATNTTEATSFVLYDEHQIRQTKYRDKMRKRWLWIILTPLLLAALVGPLLMKYYKGWGVLGVTMFLCWWGLWTGTHNHVLLLVVQMNIVASWALDDDDGKNSWAPVAAAALTIFMYQAILLHTSHIQLILRSNVCLGINVGSVFHFPSTDSSYHVYCHFYDADDCHFIVALGPCLVRVALDHAGSGSANSICCARFDC